MPIGRSGNLGMGISTPGIRLTVLSSIPEYLKNPSILRFMTIEAMRKPLALRGFDSRFLSIKYPQV